MHWLMEQSMISFFASTGHQRRFPPAEDNALSLNFPPAMLAMLAVENAVCVDLTYIW